MTWMCDKLNLPDPEIEKTPKAEIIEAMADEYVSHLLEKWRLPLADITDDKFHKPTYCSILMQNGFPVSDTKDRDY